MRQFLIDMLKRLEFLCPPPARCHHVITLAQYFGSDETERAKGRLSLRVNCDGYFFGFFLDDEDFHREAEAVANDFAEFIRKEQTGHRLTLVPGSTEG